MPGTKNNNNNNNVMSFPEYLYRSGNTGFFRRAGNVITVAANLVNGLVNPHGHNAPFSEGARRQMVGAALNPEDSKKGKQNNSYGIKDKDHIALGGITERSGKEFRNSELSGVKNFIKSAADAPYHNTFGQTAVASLDGKSFFPYGDGYTFNNVWTGDKATAIPDGSGNLGIVKSIKAGWDAWKSGATPKAAIETAGALRGMEVGPGKGAYVSPEKFAKYEQEYQDYLNLPEEKRNKINIKMGYQQ